MIPQWAYRVVNLWAQCRGEYGLDHLPDRGAMNDQSAWLLDAFAACMSADVDLRKEERP